MHHSTNKKTIPFNNKKRLKILLSGVLLTLLAGVILAISLQSDSIKIMHVLVCSGLVAAGLVLVIGQTVRMMSKTRVGLEMDHSGFDFKATSLGRSVGKINWQDIRGINAGMACHTNQLFVKLTVPEKYAKKISNLQMQKIIIENGLPLNASELEIDFHEMETYIMQYYHRYHSSRNAASKISK